MHKEVEPTFERTFPFSEEKEKQFYDEWLIDYDEAFLSLSEAAFKSSVPSSLRDYFSSEPDEIKLAYSQLTSLQETISANKYSMIGSISTQSIEELMFETTITNRKSHKRRSEVESEAKIAEEVYFEQFSNPYETILHSATLAKIMHEIKNEHTPDNPSSEDLVLAQELAESWFEDMLEDNPQALMDIINARSQEFFPAISEERPKLRLLSN